MEPVIVLCAKYGFVVGPALLLMVWFRASNTDRRTLFLRSFAVAALCFGLFYVAGQAYHDQRPFVRLHTQPLLRHAANNGFPSAYTLCIAACAFVVLPYSRAAAVAALIATALVGWARVASLLHGPLDIAASVAIAAAAAVVAKVLVRRNTNWRRPPAPAEKSLPSVLI